MNVAISVVVLFSLMAAGWVARKLKVFSDEAVKGMSALLLSVTMPALILSSLQRPFSPELLHQSLVVLLLVFAVYAVSFPVAFLSSRMLGGPKEEKSIIEYGLVFANVAYMGFPVIDAMFGKDALFFASLCIVPFNLLAFSLGAFLIARHGKNPLRMSFGLFVNPNTVATLLGFALFLGSVALPGPLLSALNLAGGVTTPLSMIITGAILARADARSVFTKPRIYAASVLRLLLFPVALFFTLRALGFHGFSLTVPVILSAMPVAANTPILAETYGGNAELGSSFVFITTLFSIATIPLVAALFAGTA